MQIKHYAVICFIFLLLAVSFVFLPAFSFAFFCPNNFNQIELGYTTDQVIKQCGVPDKQIDKLVEPPVPQEWSYFIPQTVATASMVAAQGTLKTSITFNADGKAVNISVNGIGVGNSTICGGNMIQLGDTIESVKKNCGTPSFINKQDVEVVTGQPAVKIKITEFSYSGNRPGTLIFTNGQLTERK